MTGYPFIWRGKASENFNISILTINDDGWSKIAGGDHETITDEINRNPELLFLGAKQTPTLSFPIEFVCEYSMDTQTLIRVKDWLFGSLDYQKLQICIDGLEKYYFNCILKPKEDYIFADGFRGFSATVECNSPFAWEDMQVKRYSQPESGYGKQIFYNLSADSEMLKPIIKFTSLGGDFKIINKSLNISFEWTGLQDGETIFCDCKTGIITSSTGLSRFNIFNKQFLKLQKGVNQLEFWGKAKMIEIKYKNAIRLGGGFY